MPFSIVCACCYKITAGKFHFYFPGASVIMGFTFVGIFTSKVSVKYGTEKINKCSTENRKTANRISFNWAHQSLNNHLLIALNHLWLISDMKITKMFRFLPLVMLSRWRNIVSLLFWLCVFLTIICASWYANVEFNMDEDDAMYDSER